MLVARNIEGVGLEFLFRSYILHRENQERFVSHVCRPLEDRAARFRQEALPDQPVKETQEDGYDPRCR